MKRLYESIIERHLALFKQMVFLAGPRQVGKTTISKALQILFPEFIYLNWDNQDHREIILRGPAAVAEYANLTKIQEQKVLLVFDELHKYSQWKIFLKGFFDTYSDQLFIIVTGSSKLDVYRKGGDSLMGRYFPYSVHPLSVAECLRTTVNTQEIHIPQMLSDEVFQTLFEFGGFPEPFLKANTAFSLRWQTLRQEQLFQQDIRDLSRIQEMGQLEVLAELIRYQAGQQANYTSLANKVRVSVDTVRRWIKTLSAFYFCFTLKPWTRNITRSLLKEPKIYLWDWSNLTDKGAKAENFIACHLLKAVQIWTDLGLGNYDLYYLRDKEKREVDFLITKNQEPWFLVEVKLTDNSSISPSLYHYQRLTQAPHAFQVVIDLPYVNKDCFTYTEPVIVPAKTFLSQLV